MALTISFFSITGTQIHMISTPRITDPDAGEISTVMTPGHPVYKTKKFEYVRIWMRKPAAAAVAAKAGGETTLRAPKEFQL